MEEKQSNKALDNLQFFIKISMIISFILVIFIFLNLYTFNENSFTVMDFIASSKNDNFKMLANHKIQLIVILLVLIVTISFRNSTNINIIGLGVDILMTITLVIVSLFTQPQIETIENEVITLQINYQRLYMFIILALARVVFNVIAIIKAILLIKNNELENPFKDGYIIETVISETQDAMLGEGNDFTNDIPAQMETSNGRRVINKVQTRRNVYKRLFKDEKFLYPLVLILIAIIGTIILLIL